MRLGMYVKRKGRSSVFGIQWICSSQNVNGSQCCSTVSGCFCSDGSALPLLLLPGACGITLLSHQGCTAAPISVTLVHTLFDTFLYSGNGWETTVCLNGFLCTSQRGRRRNTTNRLACFPLF